MTQSTEQDTNILYTITSTASQAFTQEVFLFLFVCFFIFIRDKLKKQFKLNHIKNQYFIQNAKSEQVRQLLISIMNLIDADRVLLLQFHNGDSFFGSFEQLKVTLTHQITQPSINNIPNIVALPITILHREIETFNRNPDSFEWVYQDKTFPRCAHYLQSIGVELYGAKLLVNKLNVPIAIIGIHFCSKDYNYTIFDNAKLKELDSITNKIQSLSSL